METGEEERTTTGTCRSCKEVKDDIIEDNLCSDCWLGREFMCSQLGCSEKELTTS